MDLLVVFFFHLVVHRFGMDTDFFPKNRLNRHYKTRTQYNDIAIHTIISTDDDINKTVFFFFFIKFTSGDY